jgi:kynurenine formamidase
VNFIQEAERREAAKLVRRGATFGLDLPLDAFAPPLIKTRKAPEHTVFSNGVCHRDDHADIYMQASTQIDSLKHMRHHHHGFYNGVSDESVTAGERLGVDQWARDGVVGRAVLADLPRHFERIGRAPTDHAEGEAYDIDLIEACLAAQGVKRRAGDILLLRTGWLDYYFNQLDDPARSAMPAQLRSAGLAQSEKTLEYLWDTRVSVIGADNVGVEAVPAMAGSKLNLDVPPGAGIGPGLMHLSLIPLMGFLLGELWWLDDLAADCASDGVYEMMLTMKPLFLVGGAGSPANAIAMK